MVSNISQKNDYATWSKSALINEINKLRKRKKYGLVWDEEKVREIFDETEEKLPILQELTSKEITTNEKQPPNILIEGDNYHSLSVLNYTHRKKVDIIYIDPPFNTGARNWKYNNDYVDQDDSFKHSKWLNMMSKRLILAKNLLKDTGVLICAIDENELYNLGCLFSELFYEYEIHLNTVVHNPRGVQGNNFSYTNEFVFYIFKKGLKIIGSRQLVEDEISESNLRNWGGESLRSDAENCFYPILVKNDQIVGFGDVLPDNIHPKSRVEIKDGIYHIWPIDNNGVERKWRYARQTVETIRDMLFVKRQSKSKHNYNIIIRKTTGMVKTVWVNSLYDSSTYGTRLLNSIVPNNGFAYPKSLHLVHDCLAYVKHDKNNTVILDFFAGSGTTGHAVLELNKEDKGNRQFILCTNNENNICTNVCYPRLKKITTGYKNSSNEKINGLGGGASNILRLHF